MACRHAESHSQPTCYAGFSLAGCVVVGQRPNSPAKNIPAYFEAWGEEMAVSFHVAARWMDEMAQVASQEDADAFLGSFDNSLGGRLRKILEYSACSRSCKNFRSIALFFPLYF